MPHLDKRLFRGPSDFDPDKLAKGRVRNFTSDIGDRLGIWVEWYHKGLQFRAVNANKIWMGAKSGVTLMDLGTGLRHCTVDQPQVDQGFFQQQTDHNYMLF